MKLLLAVSLVLAGLNLKVRLSTSTPRYDPDDEIGYFRAESAFQYRYARLAAAGKPLPEVDKDAQWPEGVKPRRELTGLMERLTGLSYRLFPLTQDFRWFVLLWVGLVSSLSVVAMQLLAGPAAAAAYGLSWASQANVIGSYRLETLGLPLIFGGLACLKAAMAGRRWAGPAAAAFMLAGFAAWHLTRFWLWTLLAAAGWAYWRTRDRSLAQIGWPVLGAALAFVLLPSARAGDFGHVYGLLKAKLVHGFTQPSDPALLSPIQRLEWTGPSNSPDAGFLVFAFVPLALVLLPRLWRRPERTAFGEMSDALLVIYAVGTLLASRLAPWLAFFVVLAAARLPNVPLMALVAGLELLKCLAPASPLNPFLRLSAALTPQVHRPAVSPRSERQLLAWLRRYGGPDRPVLAPMGLSASVLAYAETPVLLQPKWEAPGVREKTAEYVAALFGDERALLDYCRTYGAKLVIHGADTMLDETPDGLRYASGRMEVEEDSAAWLFQFAPEKLKGFRLVFQNEDYRVYAVEPNKGERAPKLAVWDRQEYEKGDVLSRMEKARFQLVLGRVLAKMGRVDEALAAYDEAFAAWPPDEGLRAEYNALRAQLEKKR